MKLVYIDSNYWIYWFDQRLPEHESVDGIMQETIRKGSVVSTVSIMEIAHYFRQLPKDEFDLRIETILRLSTLKVINLTYDIMREALSLVPIYNSIGLGARDCVILSTMKFVGTDMLLTHDFAFKKVNGITVSDNIR
ncbi:MAG: type II toxin-antitoxin system VapC family toxin [Thermoplasmata archaeon]